MSIQNLLNAALYSKLSTDSTLTGYLGGTKIYYMQAPDETVAPFVVFSYQSDVDENITPVRSKDQIINVRGITDESTGGPALAGTIDARIDTLLTGGTLAITGWSNYWMRRESGIQLIDNDRAGRKHFTAGGMYRVRISKQ